jgi:transposase
MKKRVYSAIDIMHVDWQRILSSRTGQEASVVVVGVDVGKLEMRAVLRWADGTFERPWSVANPARIGALVERVGELARGGRRVRVAMESTG